VLTRGLGINPWAEAEVLRRLAIEAGVPAEASVIEDQAKDIEQSAQYVKKIAESHGWTSVIVVSDPFHLPRASWILSNKKLKATTAGSDDVYYDSARPNYQTLPECLGLIVYALQRPFLALTEVVP
jgi:uncharacterized SAM-binding protein YcdF (DUF218 family)